ncbi:hypothetical protein WJX73_005448 [Symbiochloris irregularis]|uniref:Cyanocobalamin reductase (cyanide-eliminating) n=1 Tax=Symbiochloris irregularis TaxID=706552 RepID=A0AAW1PZZ1_9CHLO
MTAPWPLSGRRGGCAAVGRDSQADYQTILRGVQDRLQRAGFDIVEPLCLGWYNEAVEDLQDSQIPLNTAPGAQTLAVLVGNSKNMWTHLLEACRESPALLASQDPVDSYCERTIQAATSAEQRKTRIFYSHEEIAGGGYVAMQRLADITGCAYNDNLSHLSLHPRFGPWFALRALIVFDGVKYTGQRKPRLPNPMCRQTASYVKTAVRTARTPSLAERSSSQELAEGLRQSEDADQDAEVMAEVMRRRWRKWVAVRDAPSPGHPWRYPEDMITYHYTSNKGVLAEAVKRFGRSSLSRTSSSLSRATISSLR